MLAILPSGLVLFVNEDGCFPKGRDDDLLLLPLGDWINAAGKLPPNLICGLAGVCERYGFCGAQADVSAFPVDLRAQNPALRPASPDVKHESVAVRVPTRLGQ